jgi:translation initiation factor IF-3
LDRSRFSRTDADSAQRRAGHTAVDHRINDQIRAAEIRLVGPEGEQIGVVARAQALQVATEVGLDLVEVAPNAVPPVCKLIDYGKFKYEAGIKAREARRNQQHTTIKAMNFRPKIDNHDFETKKGHVLRFLRAGDKVKITVWFRGRERYKPELGLRILDRLAQELAEYAVVESTPRQDGRNMVMVVVPIKPR